MNFSIGDFSKLHISLQGIIIGIILLMPLWFINIYLFHKSFFISNPLYLIILFSYGLSIGWLVLNLLVSAIFLGYLVKEDPSENAMIIYAVAFSVVQITFQDGIGYIGGGFD